jgi:hypothetical protein
MLKFKHQCHCTYGSEIGTCIINDAGGQVAHKKQRKYTFLYMSWRQILTFKKITKLNDIIPLLKLSSDFSQGSNIYKLWENDTQVCCPFHFSC